MDRLACSTNYTLWPILKLNFVIFVGLGSFANFNKQNNLNKWIG